MAVSTVLPLPITTRRIPRRDLDTVDVLAPLAPRSVRVSSDSEMVRIEERGVVAPDDSADVRVRSLPLRNDRENRLDGFARHLVSGADSAVGAPRASKGGEPGACHGP